MEAKDTILTEEQLMTLNSWERDAVLGVQAEISFKAGRREVVEELNKFAKEFKVSRFKDVIESPLWQAKLKDWGL